jgi:hypothetical protein
MSGLLRFEQFDPKRLLSLLDIREPLGIYEQPHRQLQYVAAYVERLGAKAVLIEQSYIDRDYIDDHNSFYGSSLTDPTNRCQRVHFFSLDPVALQKAFKDIRAIAFANGRDKYDSASGQLSDRSYLGFTVIKPLRGSPVGRTVLRHCPELGKGGENVRDFSCTRYYSTHVGGVELRVKGLAFQQQDLGVSACATTALWSAISKATDFEQLKVPTPASITMLASRYSLPHGRAMPSEGLSLDQMCQAVEGVGLAPLLYNTSEFATARRYIHTAVRSSLSAVLILEENDSRHAVTLTGMRIDENAEASWILPGVNDASRVVKAAYVHDDRHGPYVRANLVNHMGKAVVELETNAKKPERWGLSHILVPLHHKVRLAFGGVSQAEAFLAPKLQRLRQLTGEFDPLRPEDNPMTSAKSIQKATRYLESLMMSEPKLTPDQIDSLINQVELSRYVGVVTFSADSFGRIEVVLDTTSTSKDVQVLCVITRGATTTTTRQLALTLADEVGAATWI